MGIQGGGTYGWRHDKTNLIHRKEGGRKTTQDWTAYLKQLRCGTGQRSVVGDTAREPALRLTSGMMCAFPGKNFGMNDIPIFINSVHFQ